MKKAKLFIISLTVLSAVNSYSQEKTSTGAHFGIKAGINIANITAKSSGISVSGSSLIAPTGGFFATLPVGTSGFQIQPELLYSGLGYKISSQVAGTDAKANFNYLVVPVLAKYTFETSGFGAYIGPQIGFLLSAKQKSEGTSEDIKDQVKSTDVAGIIGVDYTFPMGFNLSARYQLGLTNIAKDAGSGESLKNHAITFTLGYRLNK